MLKTATEKAHFVNIHGTLCLVCSRYCRIIPMNLCKIRAVDGRHDRNVATPAALKPNPQISNLPSRTYPKTGVGAVEVFFRSPAP